MFGSCEWFSCRRCSELLAIVKGTKNINGILPNQIWECRIPLTRLRLTGPSKQLWKQVSTLTAYNCFFRAGQLLQNIAENLKKDTYYTIGPSSWKMIYKKAIQMYKYELNTNKRNYPELYDRLSSCYFGLGSETDIEDAKFYNRRAERLRKTIDENKDLYCVQEITISKFERYLCELIYDETYHLSDQNSADIYLLRLEFEKIHVKGYDQIPFSNSIDVGKRILNEIEKIKEHIDGEKEFNTLPNKEWIRCRLNYLKFRFNNTLGCENHFLNIDKLIQFFSS